VDAIVDAIADKNMPARIAWIGFDIAWIGFDAAVSDWCARAEHACTSCRAALPNPSYIWLPSNSWFSDRSTLARQPVRRRWSEQPPVQWLIGPGDQPCDKTRHTD